jgi:flagellar assembly protein FliH
MSSSAARSLVEPAVKAFPYQELSEDGMTGPQDASLSLQQQAQREATAHAAAVREGTAQAQGACDLQIEQCRRGLADALQNFTAERRRYFLAVEHEVVQLALNIARKILRRETQIDAQLLAGMVRVALDQTGQATQVTVRAHPEQVSALRAFFARAMGENPPQVLPDAALEVNSCVLETALGSTEIGPEIQLKEIERGLLDLQAITPR